MYPMILNDAAFHMVAAKIILPADIGGSFAISVKKYNP